MLDGLDTTYEDYSINMIKEIQKEFANAFIFQLLNEKKSERFPM